MNVEPRPPRFEKFASHIFPVWGLIFLVFVAGSLRFVPYPPVEFAIPWDKISHFVGFALLYPFALRAQRFVHPGRGLLKSGVGSLLYVIVVGGLLEVYQAALPHRSAEFSDWVADALGAVFGALVILGVMEWRRRRRFDVVPVSSQA